MNLTFLGAAGTVTGSRYLIGHGSGHLLVDCGLFQGFKNLRLRNWSAFPYPPRKIDAVVLTHAHLDHTGYMPKLVKEGFTGPVFGTPATLDLLRILLPDSAKLMEQEAEYARRRGYSRHKNPQPLYTARDVDACYRHFAPLAWESPFRTPGGFEIMLRRAGHILGAASVHVRAPGGPSILFSGDLGRRGDPLLPEPQPPAAADYVVIESTYGNREHPPEDVLDTLARHVNAVHARGGTIVIPSFAVGRMQSLLWSLYELRRAGRIPALPVYVDSPMAVSATALYERHAEDHCLPTADCGEVFSFARYVTDREESEKLQQRTARDGSAIILSASGMATGGRVLHHIRNIASDARNLILFAGYQAGGTRGADLVAGSRRLKMHGEYVDILCEVAQLDNASAHADATGLVDWLRRIPAPPKKVFVVHGEPSASDTLRRRIADELGFNAVVPEHGEKVDLRG